MFVELLPIEAHSIRPGGAAHDIVTKTAHKTVPGDGFGGVSRG